MKRILFITCLSYCISAYCQSVSPSVTASSGGFVIGTTLTQSWTLGEAVVETFTAPGMVLTQGFQQGELTRTLKGRLIYFNPGSSPLNNCLVTLSQGNTIIFQSTTGVNGNYFMNNLQTGTYQLNASTGKAWGGVNASDALVIMKHFTGLTTLSGLRLTAADVDASGSINAVDALQAMKRFVDLQSSFALGDWVFEHHTVMVTGNGNLTDNFKGLCVGDVDCSYLPPNTKDEPALSLENQGVQLINPGQIVEIPIKAKEAMEFAALSLVLNYSPGIEVVAVEAPTENQNLVFHAENGQLRIAWYTLHPMITAADERILTLKVRQTGSGDSPFAETGFQINPESVLADFEGNPVLNKTLTIPSFVDGRNGFSLSQNRPNPFPNTTNISFSLPESGNVRLVLLDMPGRQLRVIEDGFRDAGIHTVDVNAHDLEAGVYLYQMYFTSGEKKYLQTKRMIVAR